jgi:hypothetical protein
MNHLLIILLNLAVVIDDAVYAIVRLFEKPLPAAEND